MNEAGGIKKLLFNYAMARKLFFLRQGFNQDKVRRRLLYCTVLYCTVLAIVGLARLPSCILCM